MANRHEEYTGLVRQNAIQMWQAHKNLQALATEWQAQNYTATLVIDPQGNNADVTVANLSSVVHDTTTAIEALMAAGHATNVTKLLE
jgi:hypothetical protein